MTLIKSISGIRGTIGGKPSDNLTPLDVVKFTSAFAVWINEEKGELVVGHSLGLFGPRKYSMWVDHSKKGRVVVGRDARVSGDMVRNLVCSTLTAMGINVIDIGLATTPTTEIAVITEQADGGIIITASHNPKQWNALKLLNSNGEFLSDQDGKKILQIAENQDFSYVDIDDLGTITTKDYAQIHIDSVLRLLEVNLEAIEKANLTVAIDCVNSVGGLVLPQLLNKLGVKNIVELNTQPTGNFAHNPEPIPENLTEISDLIAKGGIDVGFVVDPDVDRLAIICEDGSMFNEEYTIVAVADYILSKKSGNTVSNLSSSRALRDITERHGGQYFASAVGEVNVVEKMKATNAIIGGEGNGGVIFPESHYGRDALVGIALFLSYLATENIKPTELKKRFPEYHISKNKIELSPDTNVDLILEKIKQKYSKEMITDIDGVKIDFTDKWVHLRKSNTEPIIRIYAEAHSKTEADDLAQEIIETVKTL